MPQACSLSSCPTRLPVVFVATAALLLLGAACSRDAPAPPSAPASVPAAAERPLLEPGQPDLPGISDPDPVLTARLRAAAAGQTVPGSAGPGSPSAEGSPRFTNRLILESSPYLLQHAHNPVNWYPWGDEAFARAAAEHKPVLLSVGYSTCHWCHVMERESFEDIEIATWLNENFVAIKVDREERPDIDDVYMQALQTLSGNGGWPMTLVLTADRQPFFAATYLPPRAGIRGARKGFLDILRELSSAYRSDPAPLLAQAASISAELGRASAPQTINAVPGPEAVASAVSVLAASFDADSGGFGGAPKFPRAVSLELLLRAFHRSRDPRQRAMVEVTLEKMAAGGIHDQIGGGFHRYSTDSRWLLPHFEKMLYDNAQLASLYLHASQAFANDAFAHVAAETLDYLARDMALPGGAFASATDADSRAPDGNMEEGRFFTWTPAEIDEAVGKARGRRVAAFFAVTERGQVDGRSVLHTPASVEAVAAGLDEPAAQLATELEASRPLLAQARSRRSPPLRDDKILVSWNGLAISAFAEAAFALDRPDYAAIASRAADFVLARMRDEEGRLRRSYRGDEARGEAVLDDYAFFIRALLDLFEATFDPVRIDQALALQAIQDREFFDDDGGGYFLTSRRAEVLLSRSKPDQDWAEPSGNAVAIDNLLRLSELTSDDRFRARAEISLAAFAATMRRQPASMPALLGALDRFLSDPLEVAIVAGDADASTAAALVECLRAIRLPDCTRSVAADAGALAAQAARIPWLADKRALRGLSTAYVCRRGSCRQPTSDTEVFQRELLRPGSPP